MQICDDPDNRDRQRDEQSERSGSERAPRPFDSSELGNIPTIGDDDPPYRDWWVVESQSADGEPSPP
jgi:hypothetical protein